VPQLLKFRTANRAQSGLKPCHNCQTFGRHTGLRVAVRSVATAKRSAAIKNREWPYAVPRLPKVWPAYRAQSGLTHCRNCQMFGRDTGLREALCSATTADISAGIQGSEWPTAVSQLPTFRPAYKAQRGFTQCHNCQQFGRHTGLRVVLSSATIAKICQAYRVQRGFTQCQNCQQFFHFTGLRVSLRSIETANISAVIKGSEWSYAVIQLPTVQPGYRTQSGLTQCHN
jgi:hypothetical protein